MAERKLVGNHLGYNIYFEHISFNAPALKLYGYSSERSLKAAIKREARKWDKK